MKKDGKTQFYNRKSVAGNCKSGFCQSQKTYHHTLDEGKDQSPLVLSCDHSRPSFNNNILTVWDTHPHQLEDRIKELDNTHNLLINIICETPEEIRNSLKKLGSPYKKRVLYTCILGDDPNLWNSQQPEENIYYFYPYKHKLKAPHFKGKKFKMTPYSELFAPHSYDYQYLDSEVKDISKDESSNRPNISVIIPKFGHTPEIKKCLQSLWKPLNRVGGEAIIVSLDENEVADPPIKEFFEKSQGCYTSGYLSRKSGDGEYCAAYTRNVGAVRSRSDLILFLDADTLINEKTLELHIEAHRNQDLVMSKRHHHQSLFGRLRTGLGQNMHRSQEDFWKDFYKNSKSWMSLSFPWKYVSTYCLSIKSEDFFDICGFRESFNLYGFEDVDLGFRLSERQKQFHLIDDTVTHQDHHYYRSEYKNDEHQRQRLLKKSCEHFFRLNLDGQIYEALWPYLRDA